MTQRSETEWVNPEFVGVHTPMLHRKNAAALYTARLAIGLEKRLGRSGIAPVSAG
jgi:hypothetical protein